ncbi:polysaccharide deacetylase family protein [Vibrio spartinae]|uniref:Polysaccharide deacetylase n=1 Tax=Vibrio spartinae TaxID=1918945 RepID=A0A1N6M4L5_9VIBR|nr:polysaccharide deacetylase family protein [Vibrio spartinae]QMV13418.1 Polysaccharide deacetylase [Vibrio spartinae]SIO94297.1 Polysaccharide deacetylase [Vibrio spartinae]
MIEINNLYANHLKLKFGCFFTGLILVLMTPFQVSADTITYPNGAHVAVHLSYDDALSSQLDHAVPTLDQYNIKGSFYLLPGSATLNNEQQVEAWKKVAQNGHELGNHTVFHPCSSKGPNRGWVKPYASLEQRTPEWMAAEVKMANTFLFLLDGQKSRTLTPPCFETMTGSGDYLSAVRPLVAGVYGHTLPKPEEVFWSAHNVSGQQLINYIKRSAANPQTKIIGIKFHGVGGDYLSTSNKAHKKLVRYLAKHHDQYWVTTYKNIVDYIKQQ